MLLQVGLQRQVCARARTASVRCQTDCARPGRDNGRVLQRESSTAAWPALCAAVAGVLLAGVLLLGAVAQLFVRVAFPRVAADVDPPPLLLAGPHVPRCPNCGWIEAKRELAPLDGEPQALRIYEYTLRMQDGSMRVFQETLPASWRLGERVMLIESNGALD